MKNILKYVFIVTGILFPGILWAQYAIPNGSFENWTGINQPANWQVVQGKPTQGNVYSYPYVDYPGDTLHVNRPAKNGLSFIDMPMSDSITPCIISQKFPVYSRPKYFSMNYAYFPEGSENQFQVSFLLTKWNTGTSQEDTILSGDYNDSAGMSAQPWTTILNADLSALYDPNNNEVPDSATIIINSSLQSSPNLKTVLLIDEIYFTDTIVKAGVKIPDVESSGILAYPNPFADKTTIKYQLDQSGQVILNVYDIKGKMVSTLISGQQASGLQEVNFDAKGLKNGIYFYQLQTGSGVQTGKLILSK